MDISKINSLQWKLRWLPIVQFLTYMYVIIHHFVATPTTNYYNGVRASSQKFFTRSFTCNKGHGFIQWVHSSRLSALGTVLYSFLLASKETSSYPVVICASFPCRPCCHDNTQHCPTEQKPAVTDTLPWQYLLSQSVPTHQPCAVYPWAIVVQLEPIPLLNHLQSLNSCSSDFLSQSP